jgi:hypothetical protein
MIQVTKMLRPADVLEKTDKGHEELRTRQYKLPAKMRAVLLMVDGSLSVGGLQEQMTDLGFADDALDGLVEQGFLQVRGGAAAPAPAAPVVVEAEAVPADVTPFAALRRLMNESVHKTLGLKGFFFTLKIEKSSNIEDLRELFPEYEALMKKALSEETAELFLTKARSLLA